MAASVDPMGVDLAAVVDLTDVDLTGLDLTRAELTGADLTDATLTRVELTDATLTNANLTRVDLDATRWATDLPPTTDWPHLVTLVDQRRPARPAGI